MNSLAVSFGWFFISDDNNNFQVEDWHVIVGPLIDKMLAEPSNAVIVRFLSHISEYLADAVDLVFDRLILYMKEQNE